MTGVVGKTTSAIVIVAVNLILLAKAAQRFVQ